MDEQLARALQQEIDVEVGNAEAQRKVLIRNHNAKTQKQCTQNLCVFFVWLGLVVVAIFMIRTGYAMLTRRGKSSEVGGLSDSAPPVLHGASPTAQRLRDSECGSNPPRLAIT